MTTAVATAGDPSNDAGAIPFEQPARHLPPPPPPPPHHRHHHHHPSNGGGIAQNENYEGLLNQFNLNFGQEKDFYAKEAFLRKARKEKPRTAGQSKTKNGNR
jgi:hypothetical protein